MGIQGGQGMSEEGQKREGGHGVSWILAIMLAAGVLAAGGGAGWDWMFGRPYCIQEDCRGRGLDVEMIKQWEKQAENGALDILKIAGWRIGANQMVVSISTGRKQRAEVIWVYGSMELTQKAGLLGGRFGLSAEEDWCVISEELAGNLFGSTDVVGECVKIEEEKMIVAGVIEKEGEVMMVPAIDGRIEYVAIEFDGRAGAEGKMKRLLEEY